MNWNDMTREQLQAEKGRWDDKLQQINIEIAAARRRAAAGQGFLPVDELADMEHERRRIVGCMRVLQGLLSQRKAERRASADLAFDARFRQVAKLILEEDLYEEIMAGAKAMAVGETA